MRKALKILGIAFGVLVLLIGGALVYVNAKDHPVYPIATIDLPTNLDSLTLLRGKTMALGTCAYCHRADDGTFSGRYFDCTGAHGDVYSENLTNHATMGLGRYSDGELAYLIRTGIRPDGSFVGPWMIYPHISDEDLAGLIAYLRSDEPEVQAVAVERTQEYAFVFDALKKVQVITPFYEDVSVPTRSEERRVGKIAYV